MTESQLMVSSPSSRVISLNVGEGGTGFTTNLSVPDQNCIQLMSVGGLVTCKGLLKELQEGLLLLFEDEYIGLLVWGYLDQANIVC